MILKQFVRWKIQLRLFSVGKTKQKYEGDGKTTVTVLNKEASSGLMIDTYSKAGFRLNNGIFVIGPMAIFPRTVLCWNVRNDQDITVDSLALFGLLEPKLDLLVIGYGNPEDIKPQLGKVMFELKKRHNINVEVLPTDRAVATFNFLSAEGRYAAGAFVPPIHVKSTADEIELVPAARVKWEHEKDDIVK